MNVLDRPCLVLNANWQVIDEKSVRHAIGMMTSESPDDPNRSVAMGMALDVDGNFYPTAWDAWVKLAPIYEDYTIRCPNGRLIRAPTVVMCTNFNKMPLTKPSCRREEILKRDNYRCAYSNRVYPASELTIDHVKPKSRGGGSTWTNLVTAHKSINQKKDNMTPEEAGLRLHFHPKEPRPTPKLVRIKLKHQDWAMFLPN